MAKALSDEELKEIQQRVEMMFKVFDAVKDMPDEPDEAAYNKVLDEIIREDVPNLIATIREKDKEMARLHSSLCSEKSFSDLLLVIGNMHKGEYAQLQFAASDFLQAFRAHWVFDRTEEFNVTANRLRETEARLASLLEEGETQP